MESEGQAKDAVHAVLGKGWPWKFHLYVGAGAVTAWTKTDVVMRWPLSTLEKNMLAMRVPSQWLVVEEMPRPTRLQVQAAMDDAMDKLADPWDKCPFGWNTLSKSGLNMLLRWLFPHGHVGMVAKVLGADVAAGKVPAFRRRLQCRPKAVKLGFLKKMVEEKILLETDLPKWALTADSIKAKFSLQ